MTTVLIWLVAIVMAGLCVLLWFRNVWHILRGLLNTVESAESQLKACRRKAERVKQTPEVLAFLHQSEEIYRQSVERYHKALETPQISMAAGLMGFERIERED